MTLSSARFTLASGVLRNSALAEAVRALRAKVDDVARRGTLGGEGIRRVEVEFAGADPLAFLAAQRPGARAYVRGRDGVMAIASVGTAASFGSADDPAFQAMRDAEPRLIGILSQRFDSGRESGAEWRGFSAASVRVPAVELRREAGRTTIGATVVGDGAATRAALARVESGESPTDPHGLAPEFAPGFGADEGVNSSLSAWKIAVDATLAEIEAGPVRKIVLARTRTFRLGEDADPCELLLRLGENEPGTYQFLIEDAPGVSFLGASPERLFQRTGNKLLSEAIAGTRPRGETPARDQHLVESLFASEKDRHEHQLVLDQILEKLAPVVASIRFARYPRLLRLANVQHLCSPVDAELREGVSDGELLARLHPTPAVCGQPVERARTIIRACEPFDRGLYAGPVGIIGATTDVCVAIRSALLVGSTVTAFAGAGVVAGSNAESEWRETEHKLATFERVVAARG